MGFDFTSGKSWEKAFSPSQNGVNDAFKTAGSTLEKNLNPKSNGVSAAFKEQFSDDVWSPEKNGFFKFLNGVGDFTGGLFGDLGDGLQTGFAAGVDGIQTMLLIGGAIALVVVLMDDKKKST